MKKYELPSCAFPVQEVNHQLFRIMKATAFLLLIGCMHLSAASRSQTVTLNANNQSLREVFELVEKQTGYWVMFSDQLISKAKPITIDAKNMALTTFLDKILKPRSLAYTIDAKNILIMSSGELQAMRQGKLDKSDKPVNTVNATLQQRIITGNLTDEEGKPLAGATVLVKGTIAKVASDANGNYRINVEDDHATLVFTGVGFKTVERVVGQQSVINVSLESSISDLDEVVVVGYGTVRKGDLTGSVSSIKREDMPNFPQTSLGHALQGLAAGVQVQQNSGQPGGGLQVRIRGTNSIQGDNEPLWVIDGFPSDPRFINPADITSIEILKDASAAAIYGSRGANGVVLVTTKQGQEGPTRVEVSSSFTNQKIANKLDMLNAKEYAQLYNIYTKQETGTEFFTQEQVSNFGEGVNWQDVIFRDAPVHDHSVNVSGGNSNTKFSIGTSILDQAGIIKNSDYSKFVLRGNIDHKISDIFSISLNTILNRIDQSPIDDQSLIVSALSAPPTVGPYLDNGAYRLLNTVYPFSPDGLVNPEAYFNEISNKTYSNNVMTNLALVINPIEGLSVRVSGNIFNIDSRSDNYTGMNMPETVSRASINASNTLHFNLDNIITYKKRFGLEHDLTLTGGITYESDRFRNVGASGTGFLSDVTGTHNLGGATNPHVPSSSYAEWSMLSYLGRVNYAYKGKYLATATLRADGSSRYSENNKWGVFPSVAFAWNFAEENFMSDVNFISDAKLRIGYGETGSTAIPPYYTLNMLSSGKVGLGQGLSTFFAPGTRLPADLKWESTAQLDVGLDMSFINNRFRLTADYYIKNTRDLLNTVALPMSLGYVTTLRNVGKIENKGLELALGASILEGEVKWDLTGNISFNRNKIVSLYDGQDIKGTIYSVNVDNNYINLLREGRPFGAFYGFLLEGLDENGHFLYQDLNGDGVRNTPADQTWIGDPNPNYIFGLSSKLSWKNFGLSVFVQGSQGNDIFGLSQIRQNYLYYQGFNTVKEVLYDHWSPENPNAKYPVIDYSTSPKYSNQFVFDGSYIRFKNIELGYTVPVDKTNISWLKGAFVFVSGQNLLTITDYNWWDPEVNSKGGSNSVNQGIDHFSYPSAKGFTFGTKLSF